MVAVLRDVLALKTGQHLNRSTGPTRNYCQVHIQYHIQFHIQTYWYCYKHFHDRMHRLEIGFPHLKLVPRQHLLRHL